MKDLYLYIHYPFCLSKCPYCDFNSHVNNNIDQEDFLSGYLDEMSFFADKIGKRKIKTIFFGGGTPSLMNLKFLEKIIEKIYQLWTIDDDIEITLEANPTSFEAKKFLDFKKIAINRISLGIQSLNDNDLQFLGRNHSAKEAIAVIDKTSTIFDNFSFDLIYARPNQNLNQWLLELKQALSFKSNHISLYQLTIEKGTEFYKKFINNDFEMMKDNLAAEFYEKTNDLLLQNHYQHYEISNYCKNSYESKHNLAYWQSREYLGIGAGAHSRIILSGNRYAINMIYQPEKWREAIRNFDNAIQKITQIDEKEFFKEFLLMGLRLENGILNEEFKINFKKNYWEVINVEKLKSLLEGGLLYYDNLLIKITHKGRIISDSIIFKIIDNIKHENY